MKLNEKRFCNQITYAYLFKIKQNGLKKQGKNIPNDHEKRPVFMVLFSFIKFYKICFSN